MNFRRGKGFDTRRKKVNYLFGEATKYEIKLQ